MSLLFFSVQETRHMSKAVRAIPEGYTTVTPHLKIKGTAQAIDFYKKAFGAKECGRMAMPDGRIAHAELKIGNAMVMLADEMPEWGLFGPGPQGAGVGLHLYVEDCDALMAQAAAAGAKVTMPLADMFWGDRFGKLVDPFGHEWSIATHKEDVTPEEMQRRGQEAMSKMGGCKKD
jgi:PhnB protein